MGIKILPDTNILIPAFSGTKLYASWLHELIESRKLHFSVVVVAEFLINATVYETEKLNKLLKIFPAFDVDIKIAQLAAHYRKTYLRSKKKFMLPDCFIAATCKIHGLTLLTLDKRDFPVTEIKVVDTINIR